MGSNQEFYSNAEGRYAITGLEPGRYQIRFVDPTLELVGFVPPPVTRDVIRGEATELDYHMPSVGDVLFEWCRDVERPEGAAVLAGIVHDSRGRPLEGATVTVRWSTFVNRIDREEIDGFQSTTDDAGSYRFCGVPTDQLVRLSAAHGELESDVYEVRIAMDAFGVLQAIEVGR